MKVTCETPQLKYPYLGRRRNLVVLFSDDRIGMVVYSDVGTYPLSHYREDWMMDTFVPYPGKVVLEND